METNAEATVLDVRAAGPGIATLHGMVVVVVAVAAIGNRVAGGAAASVGGDMVDHFFTLAYSRFPIRSSADVGTGRLAVADWPGRACAAGACGRFTYQACSPLARWCPGIAR